MHTRLSWLLLLAFLAPLPGCGTYVLHGRVVEASDSSILVGDPAHPSMTEETGLGHARIAVYRNPGRADESLIAQGTSHADGTFTIELPAFGAGWMDEEWMIEASRSGYRNASTVMRLPTNTRRRPIVIHLTQGHTQPMRHEQREDLMGEYEMYR